MRILAMMLGLALAAGPAAADKLYKWTDQDGNVHYTDHLPPPDAKAQERRKFGDAPSDVPLAYSLRQAIKNFPVTLYNSDCGETCTKASALLAQRGIPFTEKNAREPAAAAELNALTGKLEVPVMKLGSQVIRGYEEGTWKIALDAAGYPSASVAPVPAATATPKPGTVQKPQTPKPETLPAGSPPPSTQTENPR
jgi:glutaredoxin